MSQVGKLYKFYFRKIWQKNWLRIIVFTILIGAVWWFVVPLGLLKAQKGYVEKSDLGGNKTDLPTDWPAEITPEQMKEWKTMTSFSEGNRLRFGAKKYDKYRKFVREKRVEKYAKKLREGDEKMKDLEWEDKLLLWMQRNDDNGGSALLSTPWLADNTFFFSKTEGYNNMKEKGFWQMLFNISWWNLSGFVVLYWFIFEVLDKTFFSPQRDGEEAAVLTMTPGVKRSDIIWGKIFAFSTFYFLINIVLFLIPFSVYYFWLATQKDFAWFSLLVLITMIVGPILFSALIFTPYLFFGSLLGGGKWICSTLISFFPLLWGGIKLLTSWGWPYTVEKIFFNPIWFTIISLVCGIFFLTLYYLRYQEEDLG